VQRVKLQTSTLSYTLWQCRDILEQIGQELSIQDTTYLLQRFGVARVKDLAPESYRDFIEFGQAVLKHKVSPAAGWNNDNTPIINYVRPVRKLLRRG
jgi:hypothetical protein